MSLWFQDGMEPNNDLAKKRFSYLEITQQVSIFDLCSNFDTKKNLCIDTIHSPINLSNIVHSPKRAGVHWRRGFPSQEPIYLSIYLSIHLSMLFNINQEADGLIMCVGGNSRWLTRGSGVTRLQLSQLSLVLHQFGGSAAHGPAGEEG